MEYTYLVVASIVRIMDISKTSHIIKSQVFAFGTILDIKLISSVLYKPLKDECYCQ